jgi:hypothetical protein
MIFRRRWVVDGGSRGGAEAFELVKRPVECALDAGFIARKSFDGAGAGSVVGEGPRTRIERGRIFVP